MLNKKIISENFSRAASNYNQLASVQKKAAEKLCQLSSPFLQNNFRILDLGCGSGFVAKNITKNSEKKFQIFECDLSFSMLKNNYSANHKIQCDFENLPFGKESFDVLISSFSLQWSENLLVNFKNFYDLLKHNGVLIFCIPNSKSLEELKTASEKSNCNFHFNKLPDIDFLKTISEKSGFIEKLYTTKIIKSEFETGSEAIKSIKETGANYSVKKNFILKSQLKQFNNFCLKNFVNINKKVEISWSVSFFIFQKP